MRPELSTHENQQVVGTPGRRLSGATTGAAAVCDGATQFQTQKAAIPRSSLDWRSNVGNTVAGKFKNANSKRPTG